MELTSRAEKRSYDDWRKMYLALPKVIAIDFDGTLCEDDFPQIGEPKIHIIIAAQMEQDEGAKLILWTCREGRLLMEAQNWCLEQGLIFDAVNESIPEWVEVFGTSPRKIGATEYWDDKAVKIY